MPRRSPDRAASGLPEADRLRPVAVFQIDQTAIDAPQFPRPLSWWLGFLPIWVTPSAGPHGTIRVAVPSRGKALCIEHWLTTCAGGRLAGGVSEIDRDAVGRIHRREPLVALHAGREEWDALTDDAKAGCRSIDHDRHRCPHHPEPYPPYDDHVSAASA